ncbi:hypothetical protein [Streptomyces sp. NPDC048606]|uniref:hypothetical protein n=1 Tax=Streptomyces sp. NPDC048606 TaxID=3154726 RepID=UPI0034419340
MDEARARWIITAEKVSEYGGDDGGHLEIVRELEGTREEVERALEEAARTVQVGTFFQERRRQVYGQLDGSYLVRSTGRMGVRRSRVLRAGRLVWDSEGQGSTGDGR